MKKFPPSTLAPRILNETARELYEKLYDLVHENLDKNPRFRIRDFQVRGWLPDDTREETLVTLRLAPGEESMLIQSSCGKPVRIVGDKRTYDRDA